VPAGVSVKGIAVGAEVEFAMSAGASWLEVDHPPPCGDCQQARREAEPCADPVGDAAFTVVLAVVWVSDDDARFGWEGRERVRNRDVGPFDLASRDAARSTASTTRGYASKYLLTSYAGRTASSTTRPGPSHPDRTILGIAASTTARSSPSPAASPTARSSTPSSPTSSRTGTPARPHARSPRRPGSTRSPCFAASGTSAG
jgi:hypothetical protein